MKLIKPNNKFLVSENDSILTIVKRIIILMIGKFELVKNKKKKTIFSDFRYYRFLITRKTDEVIKAKDIM